MIFFGISSNKYSPHFHLKPPQKNTFFSFTKEKKYKTPKKLKSMYKKIKEKKNKCNVNI